MRQLKLKDIIGYLPYGLAMKYIDNTVTIFYSLPALEPNIPILRPLSDLYRTITHNGKEIVPIIELAKIAYPEGDFQVVNIKGSEIYAQYRNIFRFFYNEGLFQKMDGYGKTYPLNDQIVFFDYLNELKIDYRGLIDEGLAININTLDFNLYK
ncbi:MAG: hypothetical protein LBS54_04230 [Dysgonamonadaceae bacterium]|jgi:hypothetical protein|nr:hypothetical protein [Dysgonamonadaceae bacterium]